MNTKTCLYCAKILDKDKRGDAKFCQDECRYKYRNQHQKEKQNEVEVKPLKKEAIPVSPLSNSLASQLRGIVGTPRPPVPQVQVVTETTKVEHPEYLAEKQLNDRYKAGLTRIETDLSGYLAKMEQLKQDYGWMLYPTLLYTGLKVGSALQQGNDPNSNSGAWIGAGLGLLAAFSINRAPANIALQRRKLAEMNSYELKVRQLQALKANIEATLRTSNMKLSLIPQFITTTIQKPLLLPAPQEEKTAIPEPEDDLLDEMETSSVTTPVEKQSNTIAVTGNAKIINSLKLKDIEYKALDFKGKWLGFFGQPSTNFHCVIHGLPGQGKSFFSLLFAKYLADNNGKVIYVSGEEGHSKTMRDKILNIQSASIDLDIADLRNYEELIGTVEPDVYNFIFIDSLDNMRIDADKMKALRQKYKDAGLITICQSTKNGKMRGSNEIAHDADMTVSVHQGMATTTKNRFKEIDMVFEIPNNNNGNKVVHRMS